MVGAFTNNNRTNLSGADIDSYSEIVLRHAGLLCGMYVWGVMDGEF